MLQPELISFPLLQAEWRGIGVQQSRGWVHYAIHRPEPHIMLYRYAKFRCESYALDSRNWALIHGAFHAMRRRPKNYGQPQPGIPNANGQEVHAQ